MFILNVHEATPLYKQLYHRIREQVLSGRIEAGARLPSVRNLAAELAVSRNTVEGAYQELYAEGYLYSTPRCGYFVSALDPDPSPKPPPPLSCRPEPLPAGNRQVIYDFHPARLDPESFPARIWRSCYLDALRGCAGALSSYPDPQGEHRLRSGIRSYLERARGVCCTDGQIVVCGGLQQSLGIVAQLLKGRQTTVAVEEPGYHLPRSVFQNHGYRVAAVAVGSGGLDLDLLGTSGAGIAYVTPSHQLPLGFVMPVAQRLKLIEWAAGGKFIIEDDYDSELRYQGKPIRSLQGLRPGANVIYLGTFSKVLSPGLRVSYLVLPESLSADYRRLFGDYCAAVSLPEQLALARFMERGDWERHVRRMRTLYRKKHDLLLAALGRHFDSRAEVVGQGAGLHVVLQLPRGRELEAKLILRGEAQGVRLFPFSATCAADGPGPLRLLLGFGGIPVPLMERGVELLAELCGGLLSAPRVP